jgi:hypothetical protein
MADFCAASHLPAGVIDDFANRRLAEGTPALRTVRGGAAVDLNATKREAGAQLARRATVTDPID